jgi:acylphosphatase
MAESETVRLHAIVEGYVQGVGFRAFVQDRAARLGLTGWVRNRWDGSVEVTAEGPQPDLEKLLTALYQGPRSSTVAGVNLQWLAASGEFSSFHVKATSG